MNDVATRDPQPTSENSMRLTTSLICAGLLAVSAGSALAVEGEQASTWTQPSTKSRAEVRAATDAAARSGALERTEASYTVVPTGASSMSRAQALGEAREAIRLGLLPVQEGSDRVASASESEQIRQAGLRAAQVGQQLATK
jgi:hypothetical protein